MDKKYERVLVAIDKSERSKMVYQRAINIAAMNGAKLGIVYVVEVADYGTVISLEPAILNKVKEKGQQYLDSIKEKALEAGVKDVVTYLEKGDVKRCITDKVAKAFKPDLMICGDRELKGIEYIMLLGSVSNYIAHKSDCDVLIIK